MTIIATSKVKLNAHVENKFEAIRIAGELLVQAGHVPATYIDYMFEREKSLSTYMGSGLAIPHGTNDAKSLVTSTGISIVVIPGGVDFGEGEPAYLVIGIAAVGNDHLDLLTNIAMLVSEEEQMRAIINCQDEAQLVAIFERGL